MLLPVVEAEEEAILYREYCGGVFIARGKEDVSEVLIASTSSSAPASDPLVLSLRCDVVCEQSLRIDPPRAPRDAIICQPSFCGGAIMGNHSVRKLGRRVILGLSYRKTLRFGV